MDSNIMPKIYRWIKFGGKAYARNSIVFKTNTPVYLNKSNKKYGQCVLPSPHTCLRNIDPKFQAKQKLITAHRDMVRAMLRYTRRGQITDGINPNKMKGTPERVQNFKRRRFGNITRSGDVF